ncbi:TetR/AcrR family transcriptional regulator [Mangrovimicrobium sediminis]|uniref:TetR/AcrR family transcriptional regulator n=1 Tax=Mangrovimicrobium sediminis TaxID=2562682 RepID=A0A4Z0LVI2_9GAMM|nr:TetR/AcrR family transcriptional regulator [Haliea sp. SAOS-164]TGD71065.1 TetR/AcrR family transcriptional regulator [Haliea sp. SAOS-164]
MPPSKPAGQTASKPAPKSRPGPGRPTREQAQERNLELLDRALDLFLEKGFERTTIEGIASSVGMAKRTVYSLYGDKKSLFKASLERAINDWIVPIDVLRAAESDDLEKTLLKIGNILVDNMLTPEGLRLLRITNAEAYHLPEIGAYTYAMGTGPTLEYLAGLFTRRLKAQGMKRRQAQDAALAFLDLVVGGPASSTVWGVPMEDREIARHTRYCVRLFLRGLQGAGAG